MSVGLLLAFGFALGWIPLYVYRTEAMRDAFPYYSAAERRWIWLSPTLVALHMTLACILVSFTDPPPGRTAIAIAVFAAGIIFWFRARAQIGPLRSTRLPDEPPRELRRDGPFGLVRNPLYLGYLVVAAAPVIVAAQPILLLSYAACFAALAARTAHDERRLHRQLGEHYAAYCRDVKRLIPFVW
jgi:protein-S-isoprenylcysteine O-methyltransferase Ste14